MKVRILPFSTFPQVITWTVSTVCNIVVTTLATWAPLLKFRKPTTYERMKIHKSTTMHCSPKYRLPVTSRIRGISVRLRHQSRHPSPFASDDGSFADPSSAASRRPVVKPHESSVFGDCLSCHYIHVPSNGIRFHDRSRVHSGPTAEKAGDRRLYVEALNNHVLR